MSRDAVLKRAAISGVVWAGITILLMTYAERPHELGKTIWDMRGGILAAPLIGIAVGYCSRFFPEFGVIGRATLTVITLYVSGFIFFFAAHAFVMLFGQLPLYGSK